ncbi:type II secretion system protein F [Dietzia sp. CQ4]|uniref:type II secretion system F family protein n=1 Tax=Dietzia sp. (strain CQ4) TaxID=370437 RepID=UPI0015FD5EA6|nr:type II secretion system protein F [Dietzia sp. CQ4]
MTQNSLSPAVIGVVALSIALLLAGYLLVRTLTRTRLPRERRRPTDADVPGPVTRASTALTTAIDTILRRRGTPGAGALAEAGVKMRLQDFVFLVIVAALAATAVGFVASGPLLGIVLGVLTPLATKVGLSVKAGRRRAAFADQLDDSLQLMASSLRAGHSLLQALASVSREAEAPTSEEFARIINETRVGRELAPALQETAERMGSQDFVWVTQAIAINREVGGNLAEVLDGVGHTIRERNQIRRQVQALAAEGKLSAYILMALPVGIAGFLFMTNPAYMVPFTQSLLGYALVAVALILLIAGGLWLRKTVNIKF